MLKVVVGGTDGLYICPEPYKYTVAMYSEYDDTNTRSYRKCSDYVSDEKRHCNTQQALFTLAVILVAIHLIARLFIESTKGMVKKMDNLREAAKPMYKYSVYPLCWSAAMLCMIAAVSAAHATPKMCSAGFDTTALWVLLSMLFAYGARHNGVLNRTREPTNSLMEMM